MTPALLQTLNELESECRDAEKEAEWLAANPSRILSLCAMVREQLGWISVESALPDPNEPHRSEATDPDYSEFVAVLDSYGDWYKAFWCFSRKEWIFSDSVADEILLPVTHWKPMDLPPSAESEASK